MAAQVRINAFKAALNALPHGEQLFFLFKRVGIQCIADLLAHKDSFSTDSIEVGDRNALSQALEAARQSGDAVAWDHATMAAKLTAIIESAKLQKSHEAANLAALYSAPTPVSAGGGVSKEQYAKLAQQLFDDALTVFHLRIPAHERADYATIGKLHDAAKSGSPMAKPLGDYHKQLRVSSGTEEQYTFMGKEYVTKESSSLRIKIDSSIVFIEQMELRCQAETIANCFDVDKNAAAASKPPPSGDKILTESTISYVDQAGKPHTMNCSATPAVQGLQMAAMKDFMKRYPHVPVGRLESVIDAGVQQKIADLRMEGFTADAACKFACTKCPELYAISKADNPTKDEAAATSNKGSGSEVGARKRGADRDPSDRAAALERALQNKEKQIENLKKKQWGGRGNANRTSWDSWDGKGKGNPWNPGKGGGGRGGGTSSANGFNTPCPPDVCRQFNFSAPGCSRGDNCKFKHLCCKCGGEHPFRQCPN